MIVPIVALLLFANLSLPQHLRIAGLILGLVLASSFIGLLQFSGARFDHPLVNDVPGFVSASFANRNHFALFAAVGCLLAPAWGLQDVGRSRWRAPISIGLLLLFALIILATGSRMGALVGGLAVILGLLNVRHRLSRELRRLPRRASRILVVATITGVAGILTLSVFLDRAASVDRALSMEIEQDARAQAFPTVLAMTKKYFPVGVGFGTFDPVFRIDEPPELLGPSYFNHAHDDLLEIVLEGGVASILLFGAVIVWWLIKSAQAWRSRNTSSEVVLARTGSAITLLTLVASAADYPARTPIIMTLLVLAAVWLNQRLEPDDKSAAIRRGADSRRSGSS